jgi:hypothetical protein
MDNPVSGSMIYRPRHCLEIRWVNALVTDLVLQLRGEEPVRPIMLERLDEWRDHEKELRDCPASSSVSGGQSHLESADETKPQAFSQNCSPGMIEWDRMEARIAQLEAENDDLRRRLWVLHLVTGAPVHAAPWEAPTGEGG